MGEMSSALERGAHLIGAYLESSIGELGLTQGEAHVLAQLGRRGQLSIASLHHEFGHKRSTLTNILDRLEMRKMVRRELNPDDRRSLIVHLTASGRRAARGVTKALDALEHELTWRVAKSDISAVDSVVAALGDIVRSQPGSSRRRQRPKR